MTTEVNTNMNTSDMQIQRTKLVEVVCEMTDVWETLSQVKPQITILVICGSTKLMNVCFNAKSS